MFEWKLMRFLPESTAMLLNFARPTCPLVAAAGIAILGIIIG
jgi:hypothetical protein